MKDWKTYAIAILALWCAYLTWRTMPYQIWEANEAQMKSKGDCLWIWNRHSTAELDAAVEKYNAAIRKQSTASKIQ